MKLTPNGRRVADGATMWRRTGLLDDLSQLATRILLYGHVEQRCALDFAGLAFAAEFKIALFADCLGGLAGRASSTRACRTCPGSRPGTCAHRAGHGQADVGVDIDLAHAVLDGFLNFRHRHAVGLFILPPNWLISASRSCGTLDEPCITR